jgi:hypothetical protein
MTDQTRTRVAVGAARRAPRVTARFLARDERSLSESAVFSTPCHESHASSRTIGVATDPVVNQCDQEAADHEEEGDGPGVVAVQLT